MKIQYSLYGTYLNEYNNQRDLGVVIYNTLNP